MSALVYLDAGTELPEWAEGRVGDHLFEGEKTQEKVQGAHAKPIPDVERPEPAAPEEIEIPHREAHHTKWRSYLEGHGLNVPKGTTREEMIDTALERFPDLEIPDDEE